MKNLKIIIAIILMIALWFSKDYFWYKNFKEFYELKINDVILDIRQGRAEKEIKVKSIDDHFSILSENAEILKINDSISKNSKSDEIKIYRKINNNSNWIYLRSIYIKKNLDFYSLIVKK